MPKAHVMPKAVAEKVKKARAIKPLLRAYRYLEKAENDSMMSNFKFGTVFDNKVIKNKFHGCHVDMQEAYLGAKPEAVWSMTPKPANGLSREAYVAWCDYLVKRSPWKYCVVADITAEFVADHGVICPTNVPANFLVNMLIATRMPCEHHTHVARWYKFVKDGIQEDIAVIFATLLGSGNRLNEYMGVGHHPFDMFTEESVANFLHHNYASPNPNYIDKKNYFPASGGWMSGLENNKRRNVWEIPEGQRYHKILKKKYPKDGDANKGRTFVVQVGGDKAIEYTHEEWCVIANKEYERLFNVKEKEKADGRNRAQTVIGIRERAERRRRVQPDAPRRVRKGKVD